MKRVGGVLPDTASFSGWASATASVSNRIPPDVDHEPFTRNQKLLARVEDVTNAAVADHAERAVASDDGGEIDK